MRLRYLLAAACFLYSFPGVTQSFPNRDYPQHYFSNPLNIPISLAANFGELRPNHYHMGLDIRTQKKLNLPVYAAADGYIAKVKIEPDGFGQAIYINHPNGYTTLYAHLNQFIPGLAAYIAGQQYKAESWQLFIDVPPGLFPVKKGDLIAYSGSTGGSQGPHVHFEIRRTAGDINLNPLLFGLPVPDDTPPVILRLAMYDRNKSIYEQSPRILPVHKAIAADPKETSPTIPAVYTVEPGLLTVGSSRISFAISAFDTQSGSANPNGIYQAVLYDNGQAVVGFRMDNISYDNTRNINAHIDYKTRASGGPFLQHLSILPGHLPPSVYQAFGKQTLRLPASPVRALAEERSLPADGVIDLSDGALHAIRIEVKDAYGNTAELKYQVQWKRNSVELPAAEQPGKKFYPGMLDGFETDDCAFYIGERGLYDSVHINYTVSKGDSPDGISQLHTIGATYIPLGDALLVRIKPDIQRAADQDKADQDKAGQDKIVMVRFAGGKKEIQRPEWQGGWASAKFREFGSFQLVEDKEAPVIVPTGIRMGAHLEHASRISFLVKDNLGAIRDFRAELDGKWICFTNDKELAFIYKFDEHCPPGKHVLKVMAEDTAGNQTVQSYGFTR